MKKLIIAFAFFAFANAASAANAIENNLKGINNPEMVQVKTWTVDDCTVYGAMQNCSGVILTFQSTKATCTDASNDIINTMVFLEKLENDSGCN